MLYYYHKLYRKGNVKDFMENKNYLTIGKLSSYSGIHVKALRYYEAIGILYPTFVDSNNNYRYYAHAHIPYVKIIKLCADYGIPLNTFSDFIESESEINLLDIIKKASDILDLKKAQLERDNQFLSYLKNEIDISQLLHASTKVDLEQTHEDFILIPFDDVFFSNQYYDTINKTIAMLKKMAIEFFNRIGCYYVLQSDNYTQFLALKIRGHSSKLNQLNILHIDKIQVQAQHIKPDDIASELQRLQGMQQHEILILETFENPYNFSRPHLELRLLFN